MSNANIGNNKGHNSNDDKQDEASQDIQENRNNVQCMINTGVLYNMMYHAYIYHANIGV